MATPQVVPPLPGPVPAAPPAPGASAMPVPEKRSVRLGRSIRRDLRISFAILFVSFAVAMGLAMVGTDVGMVVGLLGGFLAALLFFAIALRSLWGVVAALVNGEQVAAKDWATFAVGLGMSAVGGFFALFALSAFSRGRQLRRKGRLLLPGVAKGESWAASGAGSLVPSELRSALASQWRDNGRTEHASVAAFAHLTLDLMALGAPPSLLADAQRDALDEIRHAELCFSLARSLDGGAESPAAFPGAQATRALPRHRSLALARLAVDSLIEGALLEGYSARLLAMLSARCEDPAALALIRELSADESRHSLHGWDAVKWCLAEGGAPVASALRGALAALPETVETTLAPAAHDGAWERFGIPGVALEQHAYATTRARVARRLTALLAAEAATARAA